MPGRRVSPLADTSGIATRRYLGHVFAVIAIASSLAACGGAGSDVPLANVSGGDLATSARFQTYTVASAMATDTGQTTSITEADQAEAADRSRRWATATLITRDENFPDNAMTIPPLYFARMQALTAAASGSTLAQLREAFPAPSNPAVAAALMRGISRAISASGESPVALDFMHAVTAYGQSGTWETLTLTPLSEAALANQPNLRLRIEDGFNITKAWSGATEFYGGFVAESGDRSLIPMLRITAPLRVISNDEMDVVALEVAQGRWLLRITPKVRLSTWTADDLNRALVNSAHALVDQAAQPMMEGEFVLPVSSGIRALGAIDPNGMAEARDKVYADLRGLDGQGGTYADLPNSDQYLRIEQTGLYVGGLFSVSFIFSPDNIFSGGSFFSSSMSSAYLGECGTTIDLRPFYLALIDGSGGVDMLARYSSFSGAQCYSLALNTNYSDYFNPTDIYISGATTYNNVTLHTDVETTQP